MGSSISSSSSISYNSGPNFVETASTRIPSIPTGSRLEQIHTHSGSIQDNQNNTCRDFQFQSKDMDNYYRHHWSYGILLLGEQVVKEWNLGHLKSMDNPDPSQKIRLLEDNYFSATYRDDGRNSEEKYKVHSRRFWTNLFSIGSLFRGCFREDLVDDYNHRVTCIFVNEMDCDLILCWIGMDGCKHHFRLLLSGTSHIEQSFVGHSFVAWKYISSEDNEYDNLTDSTKTRSTKINEPALSYRPIFVLKNNQPHIIICRQDEKNGKISSYCRTKKVRGKSFLDNRKKVYNQVTVACDGNICWTLMCEPGWDKGGEGSLFRARFENDLRAATARLPHFARRELSKNIRFWINVRHKYGKRFSPIEGRNLCFHPESEWLKENGESTRKCHGVEVYRTKDYLNDYDLWGDGGIILHELSHAWHCCFTPNRYANKQIIECFNVAMEKKLYDRVEVHGPQGPFARAYACTNAMEYFAELSVAFLCDDNTEYNKWFPFNREQLRIHDKRAFMLLSDLWKSGLA